MNNYQWLLQMDGADRKAWFDAEHVETEERALDGDTEPQNADSRERLEADMRELMRSLYEIGYTDAKLNYGILGEETRPRLFTFDEKRGAKFIELLDRQAAITEEETRYKWVTASADEIAAWRSKAEKLKEQVYELTAERDELKERLNCTTAAMNRAAGKWARANEQCNEYREKFSKCLDYADAIHALMDDEGMA